MDYEKYYQKYFNMYQTLKYNTDDKFEINDEPDIPNIHQNHEYKIQAGGGAWGYFSDDNDYTYDLLGDIGLHKYDDEKDELIKETNQAKINAALEKLFKDQEKMIKDVEKKAGYKSKDKLKSPYNLNTAHLGVIIHLLFNRRKVPEKYLKKALANAYILLFKNLKAKESSGWREWESCCSSNSIY